MKRRSLLQCLLLSWVPVERASALEEQPANSEGDLSIDFVIQNGSSMFPTLADGDLCVVELFNRAPIAVQRGEIVTFEPPVQSSSLYLKRIVGLPGEKVEIRDGLVLIDGKHLVEPYVEPGTTECSRDCNPWFVGDDQIFVLGDNRMNSSDSRVFGPVEMDALHGKVIYVAKATEEGVTGTVRLEPVGTGDTRILALTATSSSMTPTIEPGDIVLLDPHAFADRRPFRGEIAAFHLTPASDAYIRRVIGLPGEVIEFKAGNVIVDGYVLDEPYVESYFTDCLDSPCEPLTIQDDSFFVLSDNREAGEDSRTFGPVSLTMMLGSVIFHS